MPEEPRVVGGDVLSNHELKVDELLFPLLARCDLGSSLPSLLEEELWSEVWVLLVVVVVKDAFDRRRRLRSFRKEGIAGEGGDGRIHRRQCDVGGGIGTGETMAWNGYLRIGAMWKVLARPAGAGQEVWGCAGKASDTTGQATDM